MNKSELIAAMANKTGETQKLTEALLNAFIENITLTISKGEKLALIGFGTFEVVTRKPRLGRNPATGEEIKIPATTIPRFRAGKLLKQSLIK